MSPDKRHAAGLPTRDAEASGAVVARRLPDGFVFRPGVVVIGASTGGPQALIALLSKLTPALPHLPVCITLHMPRDLMPVVAGHVARQCGVETKLVQERCRLNSGVVYLSPGDKHLDFHRAAHGVDVDVGRLNSRTYCKPAVDLMFAGAAREFGARALGIVLSGMGEDGLAGAHAIAAAGGTLLVQDKRSSAVWGMPGVVARAGLAAAILPPEALALEVLRRVRLRGELA